MGAAMRIALISDVFHDPDGRERLGRRLHEARQAGADLALLPELPLNPWSPATPDPRDEDAEPPEGPRHQALAAAAHDAGIGVVGGVIMRDRATGVRTNTAVIVNKDGVTVAHYTKLHLPDEAGFHEPCHYSAGDDPPRVVRGFEMPFGVQICSDINRPEGSYILAAQGAAAILNPRATEAATFDRWRLVFRAIAMTTATYVLSVNRPRPEGGVPLGGPSIAVDPNGDVIAESTDAVVVVSIEAASLELAAARYPGYLKTFPKIYAKGWKEVHS